MERESGLSELVAAATEGNVEAWYQIVNRYSPLLLGVLRRYRVDRAVAEDVAQTVWLRLVEHLGDLREPRALPMWICPTARRECLRHLTDSRRAVPRNPLEDSWHGELVEEDDPVEDLDRAERREALLSAMAELPDKQRRLLVLLTRDPPLPYTEIAERLGMAVGSIGPTRARALDRLRASGPLQALRAPADDRPVPRQACAGKGEHGE
jgi:RNA polymerase sigma factor (sigma-70 family)